MKRYIYIIIGIVVLAIIAIVVILFLKNGSSSVVTTNTPSGLLPSVGNQSTTALVPTTANTGASSSSTLTGGAPQAAIKSFGALSNAAVLDYFIDEKNNVTTLGPDGTVITISNGQSTTISSSSINGIISASFSYDGKKILVSFGNPSDPQTSVFDVASKKWSSLPQNLQSPQWSPSNNYQIAYLTPANGMLALSIINATNLGSGIATVFSLHAQDLTLKWLTANQFILSDKPTSRSGGSVWLYNSQTAQLTSLLYEVAGVDALWSSNALEPYGIVFSDGSSGQNPNLQMKSFAGNTVQQFNFVALPSMCLLNTERTSTSTSAATSSPYLALYCGIPRSTSGFLSARLPDDYESMAVFASDDIYKINTVTGQSEILWADQTQNMDVSDMKLFNGMLFFVNRYDKKLYGLSFS